MAALGFLFLFLFCCCCCFVLFLNALVKSAFFFFYKCGGDELEGPLLPHGQS